MFFDTDCAGIVHNLAYLRFIETARTLLARQMGMDLADMGTKGMFPVVVRMEVDYKRSAALADVQLVVDGWLAEFDRTRFWMDFEVRRPSDDTVLVKSHQMLCLVQMSSGRPQRLPEDWATRWPAYRKVGRV